MTPSAELPRARLVHRTAARARLRLPQKRRDSQFFERLQRELAALPSVDSARADPLTGSVLIHYRGELDDILKRAREQELFELQRPSRHTPIAQVQAGTARFDGWLRSISDGRMDVDNLAVLGLFGIGMFQIARGHVLPAGFALVWQAAGIARGAADQTTVAELASEE